MSGVHSKLILKSTNKLFDFLGSLGEVPCGLPSATVISNELGISRTTVQKLLGILYDKGLARQDGNNRILLRRPEPGDYFSDEESEKSKSDHVERHVLKKLSSYELKPGDRFSELELAREFGTSTIMMREALQKIGQSGIIKKHPHQKWEVIEFSTGMIDEIATVRKLFEDFAMQVISTRDAADPIWERFRELLARHRQLLDQKEISHSEMRAIEKDFHIAIIEATGNRFIRDSCNSVFTLVVFHLWQIEYDRSKIENVLKHHLQVLEYLVTKDFENARRELLAHLDHARESMKKVNEILSR